MTDYLAAREATKPRQEELNAQHIERVAAAKDLFDVAAVLPISNLTEHIRKCFPPIFEDMQIDINHSRSAAALLQYPDIPRDVKKEIAKSVLRSRSESKTMAEAEQQLIRRFTEGRHKELESLGRSLLSKSVLSWRLCRRYQRNMHLLQATSR